MLIKEKNTPSDSQVNWEAIRQQFPLLNQQVSGQPLTYLDNAATSQKPQAVIDALNNYYTTYNANVHRGVHYLSQKATDAFEAVRIKIQKFINAGQKEEIVFTKGTTDSINLVASTYGRKNIKKGDAVIISAMEHHSNIVPWQLLCEEKEAELRILPITKAGEWQMEHLQSILDENVKLVAISHISNTLGTINPVKKIIAQAHALKIPVLVDGAQAVSNIAVDVKALDCDFYAFSSHKMCGPTGFGVLYGKAKFLENMPPYQGGGEMIKDVSLDKSTYNEIPYKFEAGTPNIAGAIGTGSAIDYLQNISMEAISARKQYLLKQATKAMQKHFSNITYYGTAPNKSAVISFLFDGLHPLDVGIILDKMGVAVRTGHHCTQPIMQFYNIPGTVRASFAFYNNEEDINAFVAALAKAEKMLM